MICTFYSYKGGVGRSMALANIGEWLYLHGLRVVLVDWDLEAPGLEAFFPSDERSVPLARQPGLLDLLLDYKEDLPYLTLPPENAEREEVVAAMSEQLPPVRSRLFPLRSQITSGPGESALWILPAGQRADDAFTTYARAVQRFDWADFYRRYRGEAFFEWLRADLLAEDLADIVLIDTRTGISEMGGVATRQLADVIISFCVPNAQNIEGVMNLIESFVRDEVKEARGRPVELLVIPTRIENSEIDARNAAKREFGITMEHLLPEAMRRERLSFWDLKIPYVPKYAYRETLAVGAPDSAEELVAAYERIALQLLALAPEGSRPRELADGGLAARRTEPVSLPNVSNFPPRIPLVVGRGDLLGEMRSRLTDTQAPLVLYGLGGVGKTTLAIEYAHRFQPDYEVTWWIDATSPESIATGYTELGRQLEGEWGTDGITEARRWLASHSGWLLVLDGASDPAMLRQHVPGEQRGHVLITSLNPRWGTMAVPIEVPVLDRADSIDLIMRRTGEVDPASADRLAVVLGDLPLALEQACSYMEATGRSIGGYLELYEREGARFLRRGPQQTLATESVSEAWERSYRDLLRHPVGRDLLALCSMLAPQEIPLDVLASGRPVGDPRADFLFNPTELDEAIAALRLYSFAATRYVGLWIHPLLQSFVRDWLGDKDARGTAARAVKVVHAAFPPDGLAEPTVAERLLPHARAAVRRAIELETAPVEVVSLLGLVASHEQVLGDPEAARATLSLAVEHAAEAVPHDEALIDAVTRARVALLVHQGDLEAAHEALLQDLDRAHESESPAFVARVLGDLGIVSMRLGDSVQAERATTEALSIAEKLPNREELARLLVNHAAMQAHRGELRHAGELALEGHEIARKLPDGEAREAILKGAAQILEGTDASSAEGLLEADLEHGPIQTPSRETA